MRRDQWYFAYGSNLSEDRKVQRTGRIRNALVCRLQSYRFVFNKRGKEGQIYANIVSDPIAEVWGVAYLCNRKAIETMDCYEGVDGGHYKQIRVTVESKAGAKLAAITYVAGEGFECAPGKPTAEYLNLIICGAKHHSLPVDYIEQIKALAY